MHNWHSTINLFSKKGNIAHVFTAVHQYAYKATKNAQTAVVSHANPIGEWRRNVVYVDRFGQNYNSVFIVDGKILVNNLLPKTTELTATNVTLGVGTFGAFQKGAVREISIFGTVIIID